MLAQPLRWPDERGAVETGDWRFERKLDGLRGIAVRDGSDLHLWSRNQLSYDRRFPGVLDALAAVPVPEYVLDGEIVALHRDESSFALLQSGDPSVEVTFFAFDVLSLLGRDTTGLPLEDRVALVDRATAAGDGRVRRTEFLDGPPADLLEAACRQGWEGLLAKRRGSTYRSGRSGDWRKIKCVARQELVVVGWTEPTGSRLGFGALLLAYRSGSEWSYAGKVGTGFDDRTLVSLHRRLRDLEVASPPVSDPPGMPGSHWARPELVAEVAFTEWTRDGRLRHPSFLGLRPDKAAEDVGREDGDGPVPRA